MRIRRIAGWTILGLATAIGLPVLWDAWRNYHGWRTTTNDPSAKDAYLTFLQVDIALLVVLSVVVAIGIGVLGRRPRGIVSAQDA